MPEILDCREFVNADEIARGLSPFNPERVAIQAGKIMLKRIDDLLFQQENFAIETTLTTKSYLNMIKVAQRMHYKVTLLFFWLDDVSLAIKRVEKRVIAGGHHIPEDVIRRRYTKGIENLLLFTALANYWLVIDNSEGQMQFVAEGNLKEEITIFEKKIWTKIIL